MMFIPQTIDAEYLRWADSMKRRLFGTYEHILYTHGREEDVLPIATNLKYGKVFGSDKDYGYSSVEVVVEPFKASDGQTADVHLLYVYRDGWGV